MRTRYFGLFLLVAGLAPGQTLPSWLQSQYPAPSATGVPTNTRILLELSASGVLNNATYSLTASSGVAVPIALTDQYYSAVTLTPSTPLAPSTQYTFAVSPMRSLGSAYSFSFTTAAGPDTTPPHLIGFNP